MLYRVNDFVLNLTLPHLIAYDIETPETLELVVPRQAVLSDQPIAMPPIVVYPVSGGVQVNGSLLSGVDENLMRERPQGVYLELHITLSNETWAENLGAGPNPETVAFAAGLVADEENTNYCQKVDPNDGYCLKGGWMDIIRPVLMGPSGHLMIHRFSDTEVRVILPPFPAYDIFAPDLINIYIPPEAVFSDQLIIASTQIRIEATRGTLLMTGGSLLADRREATLQTPGSTLTLELRLQGDTWSSFLGQPQSYLQTQALLQGLRRRADPDRPAEDNGWDAKVLPGLVSSCTSLDCTVVNRVDEELLIITLSGYEEYDITYPETIELVAPKSAVLSDQVTVAANTLVVRPTPGTAHLTGSLIDASRRGLPAPQPISEAEVVGGLTAIERIIAHVPRVNMSDLIVKVDTAAPLVLDIEIRNDTWKLSGTGDLNQQMSDQTKRELVEGLHSDKAECTGWNALVASEYQAFVGGITVLSPYRVRFTLPALPMYNVRVPEMIRLTVPGSTLTSSEDISYQQPDEPDNEFQLLPNEVAATTLEVVEVGDGETVEGALEYFSEQWYTFEPGEDAAVLRLDVEYSEAMQRYGALKLQVFEDATLSTTDYAGCSGSGTECGTGELQEDGTRSCRCVRNDLEQGGESQLLLQRDEVVYATPSFGYRVTGLGTTCQSSTARLWFSVRCMVDVCNNLCRYNISMTRLPSTVGDGAAVTAPIESDGWQYYRIPLGNYDVLEMTLTRRSEYGFTPEYRHDPPSPPPPPIAPPPSPPSLNGTTPAGRRLLVGVDERLQLTEGGLVGSAYARRGLCVDQDNAALRMDVGLGAEADTAGLFCTDASQVGDMYVAVHASPSENNVTVQPRHWYTLSVTHEIFDDSDLATSVSRAGCLNYGQLRVYRIATHGAIDATLDAMIDVPVSAMYARRDAAPTLTDYDAVAPWPLQRITLSGCDVLEPAVWYVAVQLEEESLARSLATPLNRTEFSLTATLRGANVSLMQLPVGAQISLPHNNLCCGVYQDFVVEQVTRELALRVHLTVHSGYLEAIYLKHSGCARYPGDVGPDETCVGRCQMRWLTTYDPYTLVPTYAKEATVTVPMGVVYADEREAGNWYISVASASVVANYSLVAELVESPIIEQFIPLDEEQAAAESCGRFCVVLPDGSQMGDGLQDGLLPGSAAAMRAVRPSLGHLVASILLASAVAVFTQIWR